MTGLNRTSVGLKRKSPRMNSPARPMPQSNQRGIETEPPQAGEGGSFRPQSNQRGIETVDGQGRLPRSIPASIEPAWD